MALGFAKNGARVGLLGRSAGEISVTKLEIEDSGGAAHRILANVRDYERLCAAVEGMAAHFHAPLDVLVANAGVQGPIGPFHTIRPEEWKDVFEINLMGALNSVRAVLPGMVARRKGKIILIAGGGASKPRPNFACYAATKTALARFAESVAEEVREHNVQINCVAPGGAYTTMTDEILAAGDRAGMQELEDAQKVRATGGAPADKQIQLVSFLASDRSNHLTGKLIHVHDDWKKLENASMREDAFTLRRQKS